MHKRRSSNRYHRVLASVLCCCVVAGLPSRASAYHTKADPPTYLTGHVLPKKELHLGLDHQGYGAASKITVSTSLMGLFIFPFTGTAAPNLSVRLGTFHIDPVYIAIGAGVVFVHLSEDAEEKLGDAIGQSVSTEFFMVPIIAAISYHPNDAWLVSADLAYFYSDASAHAGASFGDSAGMLAGQSLQIGTTFQYAFNRVIAITFKGRLVVWAPSSAFDFNVQVDPETQFEFQGSARISSLEYAYQLVPGIAFSWRSFNLRLGVGYGNLFLPTLGLVSSYRGVIPDLELYFRF